MTHRSIQGIHMRDEIIGSVGSAVAKAAPPVAVAGSVVAGASLDRIVLVLTAIYLVGQISYLGWKWVREWRQARRNEAAE